MITDQQLARVFQDSLDLKFGSEFYEGETGGGYHQCGNYEVLVEGETLLLGSGDDFYSVPLDIALLRENLRKIGLVV